MTFSGQDDLRHLTANLDPRRLVRLAADIMWVRGCHEIQIVDGPGDGGRDVYAVAEDGNKLLAQCKFHGDTSKTCSSTEVSELPMALVKFGYKRGIFVTNAGLSPQAKREYLDNYPGLQLEFIDGDQLARIVLQHSLLKALWYNGSELKRMTTAIVLPLIIRDHDTDAPIVPSRWDPPYDPTPIISSLSAKFPKLSFQLTAAQLAPHLLEPYRYPEPFTAEEGWLPFLRGAEVTIRGDPLLATTPALLRATAEAFGAFLSGTWRRFTVRIGTPRVLPLVGVQGGVPVEILGSAAAFVTTSECQSLDEVSFFGIQGSGWTAISDARTTEAAFIRVYEPTLDICTTYEIEGRPSGDQLAHIRAQNEWILTGWERSVFALMPNYEIWPYEAASEPDEVIAWPWDGRIICVWYAGSLISGVAVPRSINEPVHPFAGLVIDRTESLKVVREAVANIADVRMLAPTEALHMVGSLGNRIVRDLEKTVTRTAEVTHYPDQLASPVLPASRRAEVLVAWALEEEVDEIMQADLGRSVFGPMGVVPSLRFEDGYLVAIWLVPTMSLIDVPTSVLLRRVADAQDSWLREMEDLISNRGWAVRRATRDYWKAKYQVTLGLPSMASDKVFIWGQTEDGDWEAALAGQGFDPEEPITPPTLPVGMSDEIAKIFKNTRPPGESNDPNS